MATMPTTHLFATLEVDVQLIDVVFATFAPLLRSYHTNVHHATIHAGSAGGRRTAHHRATDDSGHAAVGVGNRCEMHRCRMYTTGRRLQQLACRDCTSGGRGWGGSRVPGPGRRWLCSSPPLAVLKPPRHHVPNDVCEEEWSGVGGDTNATVATSNNRDQCLQFYRWHGSDPSNTQRVPSRCAWCKPSKFGGGASENAGPVRCGEGCGTRWESPRLPGIWSDPKPG